MIDRRTFLTGTGAILLVPPRPVAAQGKVYTVGLLSIGTDSARTAEWQPFLDAMRDLGYVKGQNLVTPPASR